MKRAALLVLWVVLLGTVLVPAVSAAPCAEVADDDCCGPTCELCECCPTAPPLAGAAADPGAVLAGGWLAGPPPAASPAPPPRSILHVPWPSLPR